jgi:glucose/arabinose dehydrogenase
VISAGLLAGTLAASASAATPSTTPPMPTPANGATLQTVATGVTTPTAFAFGDGSVFVSDGTLPMRPSSPKYGGVYVLKNGVATRLAGSPTASFGVTWHKHKLYVSAIDNGPGGPVSTLQAWSGWNGVTFNKQKVIYTAPHGIILNGVAFGADNRLYTGVDVGLTNDHGPKKGLLYDILSFKPNGKGMNVVATGMRQPWQLAFRPGFSTPYVTDLGQDAPKSVFPKVPDFILHVHNGQSYGFPTCNWVHVGKCTRYATPFKFLAPHTDPGGLGIIGKWLYLSEFGFVRTAKVQAIRLSGGRLKTILTGFPHEALIGLGAHGGWVYVGEAAPPSAPGTGRVFRVKP